MFLEKSLLIWREIYSYKKISFIFKNDLKFSRNLYLYWFSDCFH